MINELISLVSGKRSVADIRTSEPLVRKEAGMHNACPGADNNQPERLSVDRQASDAAKRLWCSAQHF